MLESLMRGRRALRARRRCHGLTVIELMVVVVVTAIILSLAVPSMRDFMARQRVKAVTAELVTDLQYARSEAMVRDRDVYVTFQTTDLPGEPPMTCYTVHTIGAVGNCDCRKPPGTACTELPELVEIKTVQVLRSTNVTLVPPAAPANRLGFTMRKGLAIWRDHHDQLANYVSNWVDYQVGVESSISGKLRAATNITGRPQVCTPDGSISGVPACPE